MLVFPNCKINIGLQVTAKREDGFHSIETIFYPIPIKDALEIIIDKTIQTPYNFSQSGQDILGDPKQNLCVKAFELIKQDFPDIPPISMHLLKQIPMGAGLGGGSADGAFTLRLLNQVFQLQLDRDTLIDYALKLGSDCPFFIDNQPSYATGRGEQLSPIPNLNLENFQLIIANPGIHVSTALAFGSIQPSIPSYHLLATIQLPITEWRGKINNDFENSICKIYPKIGLLINEFYSKGAIYAAMTGTGSTVYGFFEKEAKPQLIFPKETQIWRPF